MMFFVMATVFALRMSFPIVLTQMVYVPNVNPDAESNRSANVEIICPVKHHMIENATNESSSSVPLMVILSGKIHQFLYILCNKQL